MHLWVGHTTSQLQTQQSKQLSSAAAKWSLEDALRKCEGGSWPGLGLPLLLKRYKTARLNLKSLRHFQNLSVINEYCTTSL